MRHFAGLALWKLFHSFTAFFLGAFCLGQNIPIGTWRTHFSYFDARRLVLTEDKIFCAAKNGLFSRDIATGVTRKLSKIDGLSDTGITSMNYSGSDRVLVIGYRSGLLDFVFEDQIRVVSEIANSDLDRDKAINDILFIGNSTFLATDIGIIVIDTQDATISENFVQIGEGGAQVEVNELAYFQNRLFIITNEGVQSGSLDQNLLDFNNWTKYSGTTSYSSLVVSGENLYAKNGSDLVEFSGVWNDTGIDLPDGSTFLCESDGNLLTANSNFVFMLSGNEFQIVTSVQAEEVNDFVDVDGTFYLADGKLGFIDSEGRSFSPPGPLSDTYSSIKVVNNSMYGFHAPSPFSYDGGSTIEGYSFFSQGEWSTPRIDNFRNVSDVASFNGSLFFTSIGDGLYDASNGAILTSLEDGFSGSDTLLTAVNSRGARLWVTGFDEDRPIHVLNAEGVWSGFSSSSLFDDGYLSVDLSASGVAWLGEASGAITIIDPEQGLIDQLSVADGLPSSYTDIEISVEDDVWVATGRGPVTFADASFIFSEPDPLLPTFENELLFEGEQVNSIITDGGNRVWFGTHRGLWVFDERISEQVAFFNTENSPIPSDVILRMAYNPANGEVFVVTDQGMVSYRSASSVGERFHEKVLIFPNPVEAHYQGNVGLTRLAKNAIVKVTDINGNLVREIEANGSTAAWDLLDLRRNRISTGIYYFFSSTRDGEETYVGKIAVLR